MNKLLSHVRNLFHFFLCKLNSFLSFIQLRYRLMRRLQFRYIRLFACATVRLWVRRIHNIEKLPEEGPCIIISNHTSYFDWLVLSAIYDKKYIVFVANKDLLKRSVLSWFTNLNISVYLNKNNPGFSYFRKLVYLLKEGHIVVIYPEGTRSKSGKMIEPKTGFVKLALKMGVPIIPLGVKGAFEILPPNQNIPRFRKCEIFVGDPINLEKNNPLVKDIFVREKNHKRLSDKAIREMALRIMDIVARMTGQEWDNSVVWRRRFDLNKQ